MEQEVRPNFETDERFPSGEWKGFWLQRPFIKERQRMAIVLSFAEGQIKGEGRDSVGEFVMRGRYDLQTGKVVIHKFYVSQHHVLYEGWAEHDKGIWGVWTIPPGAKDGFHLWPKGMKDPTKHELTVEKSEPQRQEPRKTLVKA